MTAPPAGALEACLALLIEQMDMLRDDFVSYSDGKPTVPFVVLREALIAALNAYDEARPALLAALRLREWRPIAEAPKDGTRVLLWIKWSDEPVVGEFSHGRWWAGTEHHEVSCGAYCYGGSVTSDKSMEPILWRPIEPPTADDLARVLEQTK